MDNKVSIHATLAGGDGEHSVVIPDADKFLSTPPSRVATYRLYLAGWAVHVSIHATLAGGDMWKGRGSRDETSVSIHATLAGGD